MEGTETAVAAPSAPATSGASSSPATPSRPTSFNDASLNWSADAPASPASTPASDSTETAQPADATVPPVETTSAVTPAPIPFDRHKSILDNAYKERDEFKTKYTALDAQMNTPEGQRLRQWAQRYQQNPQQWFADTVSELATTHPELVQDFRSQAARLLASRTPPAESFEPDIPVYNETGQMVAQTFSADKVKAIVEHAVSSALQREVGPIKQDFAQRKQERETEAITKQATDTATRQFEDAKQWPGFLSDPAKGTVDPDLVKAFQEHPEWSLDRAYIQTVVPKLRAKEQAQVLDDLKTKAAASTGVNPGGSSTTTKRPVNFNDPALKWS